MKKLVVYAIIVFLTAIGVQSANADMYSFERITSNSVQNIESQLFVEVTQSGSQVLFTFINEGPIASVITSIYFYGNDYSSVIPVLGSFDSFIYPDAPAVVDFQQVISPGHLPDISPGTLTAKFEADAESPSPTNGVNIGESLGVLYNIASLKNYNDVINEINLGNLIFGMHVQTIGTNDKSDSFVNDGLVVPVPGAVLLGILGIAFAGVKLRKLA